MRELNKYLDFRFGEDARKKVIKKIGCCVRSLRENEQIGISVVNIYNEREDFMMDLFGISGRTQESIGYWGE